MVLCSLMATSLFVCLYHLGQTVSVSDCPDSLPRDGFLQVFHGKCYYFNLNTERNYYDAAFSCSKYGSTLALAKSQSVNEFFRHELSHTYSESSRPHKRVWIGLRDTRQEGTFMWMDGSPMGFQNFADQQGPRASRDSVSGVNEDCVAMDTITGLWYDYKCLSSSLAEEDESRQFICETRLENGFVTAPTSRSSEMRVTQTTPGSTTASVARPGTKSIVTSDTKASVPTTARYLPRTFITLPTDLCPKHSLPDVYVQRYKGNCYYFHLGQKLDYMHSAHTCLRNGGRLALVTSRDVNEFLHSQLSHTYRNHSRMGDKVWIGLNDLRLEGTFKWVDGSPLVYQNFAHHKGPRVGYFGRNDDCVAMDVSSGQWYDFKCVSGYFPDSALRPFICEVVVEEYQMTTSLSHNDTESTSPVTPTTRGLMTTGISRGKDVQTITLIPATTSSGLYPGSSKIENSKASPSTVDPTNESPTSTDGARYSRTTTHRTATDATNTLSSISASPDRVTSETETVSPTGTNTIDKTCSDHECELDCGLDGMMVHPSTGCTICQCIKP